MLCAEIILSIHCTELNTFDIVICKTYKKKAQFKY